MQSMIGNANVTRILAASGQDNSPFDCPHIALLVLQKVLTLATLSDPDTLKAWTKSHGLERSFLDFCL
jgi:hypothetical protein